LKTKKPLAVSTFAETTKGQRDKEPKGKELFYQVPVARKSTNTSTPLTVNQPTRVHSPPPIVGKPVDRHSKDLIVFSANIKNVRVTVGDKIPFLSSWLLADHTGEG